MFQHYLCTFVHQLKLLLHVFNLTSTTKEEILINVGERQLNGFPLVGIKIIVATYQFFDVKCSNYTISIILGRVLIF